MVTDSVAVVDCAARLTAYYLYTSRGLVDPEDTAQNQLKMHKDAAEDFLNDVISHRITIDATTRNTVTYPTVEDLDDDD